MKKEPLPDNLYHSFYPHERFRLALAAMARDDEAEVSRLRRTCPRKQYTMLDGDFLDLWHASAQLADKFIISWLSALQRCLTASALVVVTRHEVAGFSRDDLELALKAAQSYAEQLKGVWVGFYKFCEQAGLNPDHLLAWVDPMTDHIEEYRHLIDNEFIQPNEEVVEGMISMLAAYWPVELPTSA